MEPELQGASVMAVKELKQYYACKFCKTKIELDDDDHHFGTVLYSPQILTTELL